MKFYNREQEIALLHRLSKAAYHGTSSMTFMVGRRRTGKTELLKHAYANDLNFYYFFVSKKSETLLCEEFGEILSKRYATALWLKIDTILKFFEFILQESATAPLTVVLDEFQEFKYIDPTVFSGLQNLWDSYKNKSKLHLICCGSVYSIMCEIFENSKEPLYGRADTKIHLQPFVPSVIKEILTDEKKNTPQNFLATYTMAGGVPRYLELLHKNRAWDLKHIARVMLSENSFFVTEGKDVLIEEFGKDYKTYFSILSLIASGKTARSAMESVLQVSIGAYLENLEGQFSIIQRHRPIFANEGSRIQKFYIKDNFLNLWFRYFHKHQTAIEIGNYNYIIDIIEEEFPTYSGKYLEFLMKEILAASGLYNNIGSYWDRDGNNEIDIIACNDHKKTMLIAEVKLQAKNINLNTLQYKAQHIVNKHADYDVQYRGYDLTSLEELF